LFDRDHGQKQGGHWPPHRLSGNCWYSASAERQNYCQPDTTVNSFLS